jgi:hypothetical protein
MTIDHGKAELLLLKLIHLFAREILLVKKLEIEERDHPFKMSALVLDKEKI